MHILIIPSFYSEKYAPENGSFFRNQTKILVNKVTKLGTVYVEQKSLTKLKKDLFRNVYKLTRTDDEGILTYRYHGINLLNQYQFGAYIWIKLIVKLVSVYIEENGRPDVIHAHNVFYGGMAAEKCFTKFQIPYIITEHSSGFMLNEFSDKKLKKAKEAYLKSTFYATVSGNLAKAVAQSCSVPMPIVIPNVVNVSLFNLSNKKPKDKSFHFISVGNLLKNKGHHVLIEAFQLFRQSGKQAFLYIYGSGPEEENLKQLIEKLDLSTAVFLKGKVDPATLATHYKTSDALVLPSFKETFGVVIIEAMASGLPVIATRSGGPEDLINSANGILVASGDPTAMATALSELYTNFANYDQTKIRDFVIFNYSENVISKQLIELYKAAVVKGSLPNEKI